MDLFHIFSFGHNGQFTKRITFKKIDNSHIRMNGKPCVNDNAETRGIIKISDLMNDTQLKSYAEIQRDSSYTITFMQYYSIFESISISWKRILCNDEEMGRQQPMLLDIILKESHVSSYIFNMLIYEPDQLCHKMRKWEQLLSIELGMHDFNKKMHQLWRITNNSKLWTFQYRLLPFSISTNEDLHKYGIKESSLCTFCVNHVETLIHFFCEYEKVQAFYLQVYQFLNEIASFVNISP